MTHTWLSHESFWHLLTALMRPESSVYLVRTHLCIQTQISDLTMLLSSDLLFLSLLKACHDEFKSTCTILVKAVNYGWHHCIGMRASLGCNRQLCQWLPSPIGAQLPIPVGSCENDNSKDCCMWASRYIFCDVILARCSEQFEWLFGMIRSGCDIFTVIF